MQLFPYDPNIISEGQGHLLAQFSDKSNFLGLVAAILGPAQDVMDTLYAMETTMYIQNAVGAQLDVIGIYVGVPRRGYNDDTYRLFIQVQIAINTSQGTPDQIITIMLLIAQATNCLYIPYYPAAISLQVNTDLDTYLASLPLSAAEFQALIQKVVPAGVELYNISWYDGPGTAFGFLSDPDALGYGDLGDPTAGGEYASLI